MSWNKQRSVDRIQDAINAVKTIGVNDLVRDVDLGSLPLTTAYRVDGVHIYIDILNTRGMLDVANGESEKSHKRLLRFLHLYQRVADLELFSKTDAVKVDFQNERLHFVLYKPYGNEKRRIAQAVAVAALFKKVIQEGNGLHAELMNASLSIGIESGVTLAVTNGTKGDREPLFLGYSANHAAHLLGKPGLFAGEAARRIMGWSADESVPLTDANVEECALAAKLDVSIERLKTAWQRELDDHPLAEFAFSRPTPPLSGLDLDSLSPANSKRLEGCYIVADIDGFTKFVDDAVRDHTEAQAIQTLHVMRKELRDVLNDFGGRKVRYVGDALDGIIAEGTSQTTNLSETVTTAALTAAGMRSSFGLILERLPTAQKLGLAIGVELGPISITRLGVKGRRDRCAVGEAVIVAEEQQRAVGASNQTQLGPNALKHGSKPLREVFAHTRTDATFVKMAAQLTDGGEKLERHVPPAAPVVTVPRAHVR